jgi:hypothetical protein
MYQNKVSDGCAWGCMVCTLFRQRQGPRFKSWQAHITVCSSFFLENLENFPQSCTLLVSQHTWLVTGILLFFMSPSGPCKHPCGLGGGEGFSTIHDQSWTTVGESCSPSSDRHGFGSTVDLPGCPLLWQHDRSFCYSFQSLPFEARSEVRQGL